MKTLIITILMLVFSLISTAQNSVEITMTGFESNEGKAVFGLYSSKENWLEKTFKTLKTEIIEGEATIVFQDLPDGEYAISAFHDEDENGELDMFLGFYPAEDYATSNNAPAKFGPPNWKDAKFELKNGSTEKQKINIF
ncbi:DUF2141 domain-containing protein [Gramella sp. MAR_2010_147]|uniref:DUF2141 domain-containing protein n=1 Tax=Gramella sp. MAR_2010_147 TaxID=1250205 RepID=UPI00087A7727|nr:DUF2141 domain-containing protein [Gramella sp. MAR_2010_147]SDR88631.1 Uncharacterized conserved protein, DUF2141 family [Gramella sp. MAR_2010_147]